MKRKTPIRKKATRKVARKVGTQKSHSLNILAMAAEIEKEFFNLPSKLVALCRRETALLKPAETKLRTKLKTATAKQALAAKKITALKKGKKPATRKQTATAKKSLVAANRLVTELSRSLKLHLKTAEDITKKQAGFSVLTKELPKLRKSMLTASRKTAKKPASRNKRSTRSTTKYTNASSDNFQPSFPVLSTRVDTSEVN